MKPLKDATENTGTLHGAALALTGVAAHIIAEETGSKSAKRIADRIDAQFGLDEEPDR
ncbi:hypothetical protein ABGB18_42540 [Nonomuraea sp. B12E4]|uniref:hypothetical protein n=1 Tax=Nonomuraea sp. B12E4 TaxID=3153564 RepID=UPI00325DCE9F